MNWRTKLTQPDDVHSSQPQFIELTEAEPEALQTAAPNQWLIELDLAPGVQLRIVR